MMSQSEVALYDLLREHGLEDSALHEITAALAGDSGAQVGQLLVAVARQNEGLARLHEISTGTYDTSDARLRAFITAGCGVLGMAIGIVSKIERDTGQYLVQEVVATDAQHLHGRVLSLADVLCERVATQGATVEYPRLRQDVDLTSVQGYTRLGIESYVGTPIRVNDAFYGTLSLHGYRERAPLTRYERQYVELLAQHIGRTIEQQRMYAQRLRTEHIMAERAASEAERALADQESLLNAILANYPNGAIVLFDHDLRYLRIDGRGLAAAGLNRATMEGRTVYELHAEGIVDEASLHTLEVRYRAVLAGAEQRFEMTYRGRAFAMTITPITDGDGAVRYGLLISQDVTDRVEASRALREMNERLREANEEIMNFAGIVSHDFRSPLANLRGFSGLLRESAADLAHLVDPQRLESDAQRRALHETLHERIPTALNFIESSVVRLSNMTDALLALVQASHRPLQRHPVDMNALAQRILDSFAVQIRTRDVAINVAALPAAQGDPVALDQILSNIISNAIRYLDPARPGQINIGGEKTASGATFWVQDNGRGIAPEDRERVFLPFQRGKVDDEEGRGMGMAFVLAQVRRHSGTIRFESTPGSGTTFTFTIPDADA